MQKLANNNTMHQLSPTYLLGLEKVSVKDLPPLEATY